VDAAWDSGGQKPDETVFDLPADASLLFVTDGLRRRPKPHG
jgi:hypothetical protein